MARRWDFFGNSRLSCLLETNLEMNLLRGSPFSRAGIIVPRTSEMFHASFSGSVPHIFALTPVKQMIWVKTFWVIAGMTRTVNREMPVMHVIGNAMRFHYLAHIPNLSVTSGI